MAVSKKKLLSWFAIAVVVLLVANLHVAVRRVGAGAGRTYRWVSRETGAELSYQPSVFGSARLAGEAKGRWELVEPNPPSPLLPWNWLARLLDRSAPDPEEVIRQQNLRGN
jgi:hypothetical protein